MEAYKPRQGGSITLQYLFHIFPMLLQYYFSFFSRGCLRTLGVRSNNPFFVLKSLSENILYLLTYSLNNITKKKLSCDYLVVSNLRASGSEIDSAFLGLTLERSSLASITQKFRNFCQSCELFSYLFCLRTQR